MQQVWIIDILLPWKWRKLDPNYLLGASLAPPLSCRLTTGVSTRIFLPSEISALLFPWPDLSAASNHQSIPCRVSSNLLNNAPEP